jgi:hypothetical protein
MTIERKYHEAKVMPILLIKHERAKKWSLFLLVPFWCGFDMKMLTGLDFNDMRKALETNRTEMHEKEHSM